MNDDIVNNELYDGNAVGEGGIPAVALASVPDSPPAVLGDVEAFCTGVIAESGSAIAGAFSAVGVKNGAAGIWVDKNGFDEENCMPP